MARRERLILNGQPGDTFTNDSGHVLYQLIVNWHFSCGLCCQYDQAIGPSWPIPFHRHCKCKELAIWPGNESRPYVDFMAKVNELDHREQSKVVGRSNLTLIENGVVQWSDVVTRTRIRELREVVSIKGLDVKTLVNVGVDPAIARQAFESVNTSAHQLAEAHRRRLVDSILAKGVERDSLRQAVAERLAGRVRISSGPSGPGTLPIEPTDLTPPPPPPPPPPKPRPSPKPRPAPKPTPAPQPAPKPTPPATRTRPPVPAQATPAAVQAAYVQALNLKAPVPKVETFDERLARRAQEEIARLKTEFAAAKQASDAAEAAWKAYKVRTQVDPAEYDRLKDEARTTYLKASELSEQGKRFKQWKSEVKANPDLIPPFPIQERLKLYAERGGDAKLQALVKLGEGKPDVSGRVATLEAKREEIRGRLRAARDLRGKEAIESELGAVNAERRKLIDLREGAPALDTLAAALRPGPTLAIRPILDMHGQIGPDAIAATPAMRAAIDEGLAFLGAIVSRGGLPEMELPIAKLDPASANRSHCTPVGIVLEEAAGARVLVHEYGHHLEFHVEGVGKAALEFLAYRVGSEPLSRLTDVLPDANYRPDERGRKDRFEAAMGERKAWYVGKDYGTHATEITSMGLEQFFKDPVGFAMADPEYCSYILGVLDGSLR